MPSSEAQLNWYEQYAKNHPQPPAGTFQVNAWTGEVAGSAPGMTYQEWQDTWGKYNSDRSKAYEEQFGEPEPVATPITSGISKASAMTGQPTTYEEQLKSSIPGTLANDDIVMGTANAGDFTQIGKPTLPANSPEISTAPTTAAPVYTPATDYTVPTTTSTSVTPTANAPALPTGTNVAAATTTTTPTYGGATNYGKKSKSPFSSSGAWPVTNKKYPYKSSLFKTQASELL